MRASDSTSGVADSFERCERLCRSAREAISRARQMRSDAVQIRMRAQQTRAELRRLLPERRADGAPDAPPGTPARDGTGSVTHLTELAAFVHARLDEEAAAADLFHEFGCPAAEAPGHGSTTGCGCRALHRARQDIEIRRRIAHASEAAIHGADHTAPNWPFTEMNALLDLKALAFAYETHRLWQEEWRP
ncbi:hypothetical protein SALBM135S_03305 [Streptomyces alboniger]